MLHEQFFDFPLQAEKKKKLKIGVFRKRQRQMEFHLETADS